MAAEEAVSSASESPDAISNVSAAVSLNSLILVAFAAAALYVLNFTICMIDQLSYKQIFKCCL